MTNVRFNPPPGWPDPPAGWAPSENWVPDPAWPPAPPDWQFWLPTHAEPPDPPAEHSVPLAPGTTGRHAAPSAVDPGLAETAPAPVQVRTSVRRHHGHRVDARAQHVSEVERRIRALEQEEAELRERVLELRDAVAVQDAGVLAYHHPLEQADDYTPLLADLRSRMTELIRQGRAVLASRAFAYDKSLARGRTITSDFSRLMLRAYNAEADDAVRTMRAGDAAAALRRLDAAADTIARLGAAMELRIAPDYHELRLEEIRLTADRLMKTQEQDAAARHERARLRDEQKARKAHADECARLLRERTRVVDALANEPVREWESAELREHLAAVDAAIEQNERDAAELRAGYVYVAGNVNAFGADIVKIGMTRRPDPAQQVRELGDDSVPFPFDLHFVAFSDDAVALVADLHAHFAHRRVNRVDPGREFFFATPQDVRDALSARPDTGADGPARGASRPD